jgi:hypothetical protein
VSSLLLYDQAGRPWQGCSWTLRHMCVSGGCLDYWLILPPGMMALQPDRTTLLWNHGALHGPQTCKPALDKLCWGFGMPIIAPVMPPKRHYGEYIMGRNLFDKIVGFELGLITTLLRSGQIGRLAVGGISQGAAISAKFSRLLYSERRLVLAPTGDDHPVVVLDNAPAGWPGANWPWARFLTAPWTLAGLAGDTGIGWALGGLASLRDRQLAEFAAAASSMLVSPAHLTAAANILATAPDISQELDRMAAMGLHPVQIKSLLDVVSGYIPFTLWAWVLNHEDVKLALDIHTQWGSGHGQAFGETVQAYAGLLRWQMPQ